MKRIRFWLWERPDWLANPILKFLCLLTGHAPERDQCGRPEHDFCVWCHKPMPNSWKPHVP